MEKIKISELKRAEYNPRKISDREMEKLKRSISTFGFVEPVIINKHSGRENTVIGGHQRINAAEALGIAEVPYYPVDLPLAKEKALNIAPHVPESENGLDKAVSYAIPNHTVKIQSNSNLWLFHSFHLFYYT